MFAQRPQVTRRRAHHQQVAVRAQHALHFANVQLREHVGDDVDRGIGQRQVRATGNQPGEPGVASGGHPHGGAGNVNADDFGHRVGKSAGVVALAAADVEQGVGGQGRQPGQQGVAQGAVMIGLQERAPGHDHQRVVTRIAAFLVLHRQQIDVSLTGHVEAVPLRAAPDPGLTRQRPSAQRTDHAQAARPARSNRLRARASATRMPSIPADMMPPA